MITSFGTDKCKKKDLELGIYVRINLGNKDFVKEST